MNHTLSHQPMKCVVTNPWILKIEKYELLVYQSFPKKRNTTLNITIHLILNYE